MEHPKSANSAFTAPYPSIRPYRSKPAGRRGRRIPDRIRRYHLPLPVLEATSGVMERYGCEEREAYAWWGGYVTADGDAQVVTAIIPEVRTDYGRVHLGERSLGPLHRELIERDLVLLVELHTHPPGAGGQNEVDAAHPAATHRGFISIVVPDFALPHLYDLRRCHVYEYQSASTWRTLDAPEIARTFIVEEAGVEVPGERE